MEITVESLRILCAHCHRIRTTVDWITKLETRTAPFVYLRFLDDEKLLPREGVSTLRLCINQTGHLVLSLTLRDPGGSDRQGDQVRAGIRQPEGGYPSLLQLVQTVEEIQQLVHVATGEVVSKKTL